MHILIYTYVYKLHIYNTSLATYMVFRAGIYSLELQANFQIKFKYFDATL